MMATSSAPRLQPSIRYNSTSPLPWFVDPASSPSSTASTSNDGSPKLATAPVATEPPAHLVESLHPLHAHLSISPFLDKDSITYINSREADPDCWTDWIVIATLRQGRERGIRGAIEGVRSYLAEHPIDTSPAPSSTPFAPPSNSPLISGLPTPPSKHARSRTKGGAPSRTEQASGWAMLDAGRTVVHIMTLEARQNWGIEQMWENVRRANEKAAPASTGFASEQDQEQEESQGYEEMTEAELQAVRERELQRPSAV